jgi:hypothetical protein
MDIADHGRPAVLALARRHRAPSCCHGGQLGSCSTAPNGVPRPRDRKPLEEHDGPN